jgi:hypothetical protein
MLCSEGPVVQKSLMVLIQMNFEESMIGVRSLYQDSSHIEELTSVSYKSTLYPFLFESTGEDLIEAIIIGLI